MVGSARRLRGVFGRMPQPHVIGGPAQLVELAGRRRHGHGLAGGHARRRRVHAHGRGQEDQARVPRDSRNYIDMFVEEARVGSELAHPNIVQVFDFCTDDEGSYYLVMEWVEGIDLGRFIRAFREAGERDAVAARRARSASAPCAASAPPTSARARRHAGAGHPSRRLAAQRPARRQRRREADRLRARARPRPRLQPDRAGHGERQAVVPRRPRSRSASRRRRSPICSRWAACCGRRCPASACSTARPTSRSSSRSAPARSGRWRGAPDVPAELIAVLDMALQREPRNRSTSAPGPMALALADVLRAGAAADAQSALGSNVVEAPQAAQRPRRPTQQGDGRQPTWTSSPTRARLTHAVKSGSSLSV